jgi:HSP20 family protein
LTISTNKNEVTEEKKDNYLRKERRCGRVARTFVFEDVNDDEIKAEFKDGVLKLNLPKLAAAEAKVKRININ